MIWKTKPLLSIQAIFLFLASVLSGCSSVYQPPLRGDFEREDEIMPMASAVAESGPVAGTSQDASTAQEEPNVAQVNAQAVPEKSFRKIHYDGNAQLLVTNARATIKKIADLVNTRNGYIERITDDTLTVQVPADSFDAAFKEILTYGKVLHKVVTSTDITEEYRSTQLRLKIAKATRDRLMALLTKASSEEDKLQLLKQIEAITATIQTLESQYEMLKTKVNYSKITVQLKTYDQFDSGYRDFEPFGFQWINDLAGLDDSIARAGSKLAFKEPAGMLRIKENTQYWLTESGDKALFRATQRSNKPEGDGAFWLSAIKLRLIPKYKSVETVKVGDYELLRTESYDQVPSIYYVGLKVDKDMIKLVELYFPDAVLEEKYKKPVFDSISAGES